MDVEIFVGGMLQNVYVLFRFIGWMWEFVLADSPCS